jgi:hypothetical protein
VPAAVALFLAAAWFTVLGVAFLVPGFMRLPAFGAALVALAALHVVAGICLLRGRAWARALSLALAAPDFAVAALGGVSWMMLAAVFPLVVLACLLRRRRPTP